MLVVLGYLCAGVFFGYGMRNRKSLKNLEKIIYVTILLLLFMLGLSVGGNKEVVKNLPILGSQAFLIALFATGGSILCGWVVYLFFFKRKKQ